MVDGKAGLAGPAAEARLALGEIELRSGRRAEGAGRLRTLAAEARARGFARVARRATAALREG